MNNLLIKSRVKFNFNKGRGDILIVMILKASPLNFL